jgi:hypothetical protein
LIETIDGTRSNRKMLVLFWHSFRLLRGTGAATNVRDDAREAWIAVKRLEICVLLGVQSQALGQAMLHRIAQESQSLVAMAAESQVTG